MTPEQERELAQLLAERPSTDLGGLEGIPNETLRKGVPGVIDPAPSDPISPEQGYRSQLDPMALSAPPDLSGWADSPDQGGLGVAGQGSQGLPQLSLADRYVREVFPDFQGELGFWDRARVHDAMMNGGLAQLVGQRQSRAFQLQQLEETKRQHDFQMIEKLMATGNMDGLIEYGKQNPNSPAGLIGQSLSKQHLADVAAGVREGLVPDEFLKRIETKTATPTEIKAWGDTVVEIRRANAKEQAKAFHLKKAMDTPAEQRSPYQQQLVDERQAALDLKKTEDVLKNALALKALSEAERGPVDNSNLEKIHEMVSGGKSWRQGDAKTQQKALDEYARLMPEGRTSVMLGTPIPVEKRSNLIDRNEFLKHDKLVNPPQGATEGATRSGAYVEMTDKQREDWGNLVNSGATLQTLFDEIEPLITAETPTKAAKQFARLHLEAVTKKNPKAATYLADSEAFSSRMARVFGSEVGVLTNPDVERWRRALPTFGDTKQVVAEKKKLFMGIYKQTKDMYKKKIAGEDYSEDLVALRRGPLAAVDKIAPPSIDEDFSSFFGGK